MDFLGALLDDPRDRPLLRLGLQASALLPAGALVFVAHRWASWAILPAAVLFVIIYVAHIERFITMFHDINHRPMFKRPFAALDLYWTWLYGPMYGSSPNTYFAHHVRMHHPSNNLLADASTTLPYRRDRPVDFARYYLRFFFSLVEVFVALWTRYPQRPMIALQMAIGELCWYLVIALGFYADPLAAAVVFALPLLATRTLLIIGNWGEHAFVDPDDPGNLWRSSVELVGAANERAFNVGYHIAHHIRPTEHYTSHPGWFAANAERYGRNDAIVLRDLTYPGLWWLLMRGRYDALADRFVQLPGAPIRSRAQVIALLKRRVEPIGGLVPERAHQGVA